MAPRVSRKRAADRSQEEPFNVATFVDGARGKVGLDTILENIKNEVDKQAVDLDRNTNAWAFEVKKQFRTELMKIPKKVRKMTVAQFNEDFNGNMEMFNKFESKNLASKRLSVILPLRNQTNDDAENEQDNHAMPGTVIKKKNTKTESKAGMGGGDMTPWKQKRSQATAADMQTPMQPSRFDPAMMSTPAVRVPQKGESIAMVSMNGSPLGEYSSAKVAIKKDQPSSISVELDGMGFTDLSQGLPNEWEDHQKKEVREKLENLQSQIANLMNSMDSE